MSIQASRISASRTIFRARKGKQALIMSHHCFELGKGYADLSLFCHKIWAGTYILDHCTEFASQAGPLNAAIEQIIDIVSNEQHEIMFPVNHQSSTQQNKS